MATQKGESKFNLMFSSLNYRNFRLLWIGGVVSSTGDFVEIVALNWLIYNLTYSPFYLGLFNLARSLPVIVFTLIAGAMADKYERRKIMLYSQGAAMVLSGILTALAFAEKLEVIPILAIGILQGVANSFNLPIRQSLISELVPMEKIVNAVAMNGASLTLTLALGPALGGVVVGTLGIEYALLLNTLSFIAVLWALFAMEVPQHANDVNDAKRHEKSITQSLREAAFYIFNHKTILIIILFSFLMVAIGLPYITLLPVFARDYFNVGASGYGYLFSIVGVGALLGSLFSGVRSEDKVKKAMELSFISFGLSLTLFGIAAWLFPSYLFIFILLLIMLGFCMATFNVTNNTMLQLQVSSEYRGRVLSTLFLGFGLTSLGSFLIGWLAEILGAHFAYIITGSAILLLSGFLVYFTREHFK